MGLKRVRFYTDEKEKEKMASKCDRCGVAKSDYKVLGADDNGNARECYLCKICYNDTGTSVDNGFNF